MYTQCQCVQGDANRHQQYDDMTEVDFKWLMAGQGYWITPDKLHSDQAYANACLKSAFQSDCQPLRRCAISLREELCREQVLVA